MTGPEKSQQRPAERLSSTPFFGTALTGSPSVTKPSRRSLSVLWPETKASSPGGFLFGFLALWSGKARPRRPAPPSVTWTLSSRSTDTSEHLSRVGHKSRCHDLERRKKMNRHPRPLGADVLMRETDKQRGKETTWNGGGEEQSRGRNRKCPGCDVTHREGLRSGWG